MIDELGINFEQVRSDKAGIISYTVDGMETLTPAKFSAEG